MVPLPQGGAPAIYGNPSAGHRRAVAVPSDEVVGRHQPPGSCARRVCQIPHRPPGESRCPPGECLIGPPICQLHFDEPFDHSQFLLRHGAHAAGVLLRTGQVLQVLTGRRLGSPRCGTRGQGRHRGHRRLPQVGIGLQVGGHPPPDLVVFPEVIGLRSMYGLFHPGPSFSPQCMRLGKNGSCCKNHTYEIRPRVKIS